MKHKDKIPTWIFLLAWLAAGFSVYLYFTPAKKQLPSSTTTLPQYELDDLNTPEPLKTITALPTQKSAAPSFPMEDTQPTEEAYPSAEDSPVSIPADNPLPNIFWGYLKLVDTTFFGHNHPQNRAIIKDLVTAQTARYSLNSTLPYGSRLIRIMKDRIGLEKDGQKRTLKLSVKLDDPAARKALLAQGYQHVTPNEWVIRPNRLLENKKKIGLLLREIETGSSLDVTGKQVLQINKLEQGTLIEQLGLQEGDSIRTINGEEVTDIKDVLFAYFEVRQSPTITISLDREQSPIDLSYHIIPDGTPSYNIEDILNPSKTAK